MAKKTNIIPSKNINKNPNKKKTLTKLELEQALIDNFINLQRVLTNLSVKFDELSNNMSKMLQLFEISAKSFSEKYIGKEEQTINKSDKDLLEKLDSLLDQNKTIARGILLMEEKIRQRERHPLISKHPEQIRPKSLPRF